MNGTMQPRLIVLGATGTVGAHVVARAVADGRRVVAVARDADALAALCAAHGARVTPLVADISTDADAAALAASVQRLPGPPPGAVIAAIRGATDAGRVLDGPADFLRRRVRAKQVAHDFEKAVAKALELAALHDAFHERRRQCVFVDKQAVRRR